MNSSKALRPYIDGRATAILGLGVSNLPLARLLCEWGIPLTVYDKKSAEALGKDAMALQAAGVRFVSGDDCFANIEEPLIFRSPGIRPDLASLTAAVADGAELTSEIELLLRLSAAKSFAITGSDGKTTSTTLTGLFLKAEAERQNKGRVFVGGNIGTPLLTQADTMTDEDSAVLELSSFQLMRLSDAPRFSALTNLSPNHLDWHVDMAEYAAAKRHIVGPNTERFVTNWENPDARAMGLEIAASTKTKVFFFSSRANRPDAFAGCPKECSLLYERDGQILLFDAESGKEIALLAVSRIGVPGRHNVENFMTAMGLTYGHVAIELYGKVADAFGGVEHRLEFVRRLDGVTYLNSSIDSSPSRTAAALSALDGRDIVVICGGYDKNIPYAPLAESLCRSVRAVVLTGATAQKIQEALDACPTYDPSRLTVAHEPDFRSAVLRARLLARPDGVVLLSPASASFDQFNNFAERGNTFKQIVLEFPERDTEN